MWATGAGLKKGQRGPGKVLPGLREGEAEVCGVGMGRRGWAERNANGGVSGGDEGVQEGVVGGEEGGGEGVEERSECDPFVASDPCWIMQSCGPSSHRRRWTRSIRSCG